ncbi:MAG: Gldg family protein [Trichodesmium sp. St16_bin4-tuft]|nr:Gldg family protein [Trichodesmium sp. St18_bin3_1_1]MDE5100107.1 Gldg family protein [Trichodesmium sp. St16_bin4-tuft]MDE5105026.1 Gldg family protein [Trichodesmium sp. St19_bin2]
MKIIKSTWSYLFWLGPISAIIGVSAGFVSGNWEPIPLILIAISIIITGLWIFYQAYSIEQNPNITWWSGRATEAGTNAIFATISVLIILGIINFLAVRYQTRIDLTENQKFTLSPQTIEILENLQKPVKLWIFDRGENPQYTQLIENYQRQGNGKFMFELVDPQTQPGKANQFGVKQLGEIHLEVGEKKEVIISKQLELLTESKLTNSIEKILGSRILKIYFIQGHGERELKEGQKGFSEAVNALESKNYIVESINLASISQVPEDADVVIIAGAQREFLEAEVIALQEYLEQGGGVLIMLDPSTDPGLNNLFEEWGVLVDDRLAIDDPKIGRLVGLDPWVVLVTMYGEHPITQDFGNGISLYPFARPIETEAIDGIKESPIIWTGNQSWAETDLRGELRFNEGRDRIGPLSLGVALTRSSTGEKNQETELELTPIPSLPGQPPNEPTTTYTSELEAEKKTTSAEVISPLPGQPPDELDSSKIEVKLENKLEEARLIVLGNSQFATNGWFQQQLNGDVFLNSISWLSKPEQETLSISPKKTTNRRIAMSLVKARFLSWMAIVILPILALTIGGIIWWQRR